MRFPLVHDHVEANGRSGAAASAANGAHPKRGSALAIALLAALILSALLWAAGGYLADLTLPFRSVHAVLGAALMFAVACSGVVALGISLEIALSMEALHKFALATAVLAPLNFAASPSSAPASAGPDHPAHARAAQQEFQVGIYGGGNYTPPADVFLKQPNGTDMILKDVPWTGEPFDDPPYYGVRGTYWTARAPKFGVMLDFAHAKAISIRDQAVEQTGTRDGKPVPAKEPVKETFTKLEYSHGLNFLTLNAVYRMSGWHGRFVPYLGAGAGLMIPHTEIARKDIGRQNWTYRYEITGPGFQGLAGIEWRFFPSDRYAVFTEYKAGLAVNSTELLEGGTVENMLWAHQAVVGVSAVAYRPLAAATQ